MRPEDITLEQKQKFLDLLRIEALHSIIKEKEEKVQEIVLQAYPFYTREVKRGDRIIRPSQRALTTKEAGWIYDANDTSSFELYHNMVITGLASIGVRVSNPDFSPTLVLNSKKIDIENELIDALEPLTKMSRLQLILIEHRKKFLELSKALIVTTISDNELENAKMLQESTLNIDNKLFIDMGNMEGVIIIDNKINYLAEYNPMQNDVTNQYGDNKYVVMITGADEDGNLFGDNHYVAFATEELAQSFEAKFNNQSHANDLVVEIKKTCALLGLSDKDDYVFEARGLPNSATQVAELVSPETHKDLK
jgi:hypothetical protein